MVKLKIRLVRGVSRNALYKRTILTYFVAVVVAVVVLVVVVVVVIHMPMFMVLSSWQNHYESSPGSFDECRTAPSGPDPTPSQTT